MDTVEALLRLFGHGASWTLRLARTLYQVFLIFLGILILVVLAGFGLNLAGAKGVNLFFSLLFVAGFAIFSFQPIVLALTASIGGAVGILRQDQSATKGAVAFLEGYIVILKQVFLWGSVVFFLLGTLSFAESPLAFFAVVAGVIALAFIKLAWGIGGDLGKQATYWYVSVMVVLFFLTLIPGSVWVKYMPFGWDPTTIGVTSTEDIRYQIQREQAKKTEEAKDAALRQILRNVREGKALTPAEDKILKEDPTPKAVITEAPSAVSVAGFVKAYWLWIILLAGVFWVLIKVFGGKHSGTLQTLLAVAMFMLFIGPTWFAVRDAFLPQVICPDVSSQGPRSCNLNTAWSSWAKAAEGPAVDGMRMCASPGGQFERKDEGGITFFRFKANEGRLVKAYRLYPGSQRCPVTIS